MSRVINSGATAPERGRGVLRDVELGIRKARQVLGDMDRIPHRACLQKLNVCVHHS